MYVRVYWDLRESSDRWARFVILWGYTLIHTHTCRDEQKETITLIVAVYVVLQGSLLPGVLYSILFPPGPC
jgi:hypothetical protein